MRKLISLLVAIVFCFSLICMVSADEFVESITDKGAPEIVPIVGPDGKTYIGEIFDADGNAIGYLDEDCLLVTPVSQVKTSEEIPEESAAMLQDVYNKLVAGSMQLPYEKHQANLDPAKMVIKDLFDVTWLCDPKMEDAVQNTDSEHPDHPTIVEPKGITVRITFKLDVAKTANVYCMSYKRGAWNPVVSCVNNGDQTVTCVFEDFCPVAFSVGSAAVTPPSQTGDTAMPVLWITLMAVSIIALGAVLVFSRKKAA